MLSRSLFSCQSWTAIPGTWHGQLMHHSKKQGQRFHRVKMHKLKRRNWETRHKVVQGTDKMQRQTHSTPILSHLSFLFPHSNRKLLLVCHLAHSLLSLLLLINVFVGGPESRKDTFPLDVTGFFLTSLSLMMMSCSLHFLPCIQGKKKWKNKMRQNSVAITITQLHLHSLASPPPTE